MDFKTLPKADHHLHLVLSPPFSAYKKIKPDISAPPHRFSSFLEFQGYIFEQIIPALGTLSNQLFLMQAAIEGMIEDGVVYAEPSFDLLMVTRLNLSWEEFIEKLSPLWNSFAGRITLSPEIGVRRDVSQSVWEPLLRDALSTNFFKGVDLYGDEHAADIKKFLPYFAYARAASLRVKMHTGEFADSKRMRSEIECVEPDAVQHGVRAVDDAALMAYLARRNITLHLCPTSNVSLGVVDSYTTYPIRKFLDAGVSVTINTDDRALFGVALSEEYQRLKSSGVLSENELENIRLFSLKS